MTTTSFLSFLLASFGIIPMPVKTVESEGAFIVPEDGIHYSVLTSKGVDSTPLIDILATYSAPAFVKEAKAEVKFLIGAKYSLGKLPYGTSTDEGYALEVTPKGITVRAGGFAGAFYAAQTLRQLYDLNGNIPCCRIEDAPYFGYRGLMFDAVRHFLSVEYVKKQLEMMSYLKLNRLHFHLTDNQAFRILLDSHPEMAHGTCFRPTVAQRHYPDYIEEPAGYVPGTVYCKDGVYGGYYSKENLREIIEFAAARGIEVIPEIELPGHNRVATYVHPELLCSVDSVRTYIDLCIGKEATFKYLEEIIGEVMEIFPSKMIHIGGDEAVKQNWKHCPDCARRMKEEGLSSIDQLQSYAIKRIERFVKSRGKNIAGWDEILQGGVSSTATLMLWRGGSVRDVEAARKAGNDMIDAVSTHNYLCNAQAAPYVEPFAQTSMVTLERLYSERPEAIEHMLGVQACLWSEWVASEKHHEYMLYPRSFALAEKGWTPLEMRNDYPGFRSRCLDMNRILGAKGYTTFNLEDERIPSAANHEKIEHLASGAKVTFEDGKPAGRQLTDSYPGDYFGGWMSVKESTAFIVDLGKKTDIHYIGTSFMARRSMELPRSLEVLVSENGTDYRSLGEKDILLFDRGFTMEEQSTLEFDPRGIPNARKFAQGTISSTIFPVGFICNLRNIRYVKYRIRLNPGHVYGSAVDELIIN